MLLVSSIGIHDCGWWKLVPEKLLYEVGNELLHSLVVYAPEVTVQVCDANVTVSQVSLEVIDDDRYKDSLPSTRYAGAEESHWLSRQPGGLISLEKNRNETGMKEKKDYTTPETD